MEKLSGALLHISSLPSPYGIGDFGQGAFDFVDFLADNGFRVWQVLPHGMTGYGDSPYQSPSAFAGNPYFISIDLLVGDGLLTAEEADAEKVRFSDDTDTVDFAKLFSTRYAVLRKAYSRFKKGKQFKKFCIDNSFWLDDFALFMHLKTKYKWQGWDSWPERYRQKARISQAYRRRVKGDTDFWKFVQFKFFRQLGALARYAHSKGVKMVGDMPIYCASDSADVWGNPQLFQLDENQKPTFVAGVPPDYFAKLGQLWGNPLYNWDAMREQGFSWWHARMLLQLEYFDMLRIDHFRAFESYYAIPADAENALSGQWQKGVRLEPFKDIADAVKGRVIAEDLGLITNAVKAMVAQSGFAGMKVLQFAFDGKTDNEYLPKNYITDNCVVYTGTHDNDTLAGWLQSLSKRERGAVVKQVVRHDKQFDKTADNNALFDAIMSIAAKSRAFLAVVPMQDFLRLGTDARMNIPSEIAGNWRWRLPPDYGRAADFMKTFQADRSK